MCRPPGPAPEQEALPGRSARPRANRCHAGSSCPIASAIPRFAKGLAAVDADAARPRQQAVDRGTSIALLDAWTKLDHVALAEFEDGKACGDALLDRLESPAVFVFALRRQDILIAQQTILHALEIEIDAAAVGVDIPGASGPQQRRRILEFHGIRRG